MTEKRGMTTRYGGERPAKRREPTPPTEKAAVKPRATPAKEKQTPPKPKPSADVTEKPLPTKVVDAQPLPTLKTPQPGDMSDREYQSIKKSGVLAASLERSRHKWLTEGIFERYWTKPTKRKQQGVGMDKNPAKSTMSMLGHGRLTLEPHVFEIVLHGVKEPTPAAPVSQNFLAQRPIIQYGPPANAPVVRQPVNNTRSAQSQSAPQSTLDGAQQPNGNGHAPPSTSLPPPQSHNPTVHSRPPLAPAGSFGAQPSRGPLGTANTSIRPNAPPSHAPAQSPDPVIHMLAQRAGHDPELKAIMKIVAAGDANPQQLQFFQRHIDELTAVLHSRSGANQAANPAQRSYPSTSAPPVSVPAVAHTAGTPSDGTATPPVAGPGRQAYPYHAQAHAHLPAKGRGSGGPPKPEFSAVVFEFVAGSSDRFLFPKHSIVEFLPGSRQVLASFLIVRKGTKGDSRAYDPNREYYQPVTIRLSTDDPRVLAPLARVVAPPDEVRKHMNDIMDRATRADTVHLALRLPMKSENGGEDEEQRGSKSRDETPSTPAVSGVREKRKYTKRATRAV